MSANNVTLTVDTDDWWASPDDGVWWHVLDATGLRLFQERSADFGKFTLDDADIDTPLRTRRLLRFAFTRHVADALLPLYQGAVLTVDPQELEPGEWVEYGPNRWRHVSAEAVLRVGKIIVPVHALGEGASEA